MKLNITEKTSNVDILDSIEANAKAILDKVESIRKGGLDDYNSSLLKKQKKALIDVNSALSNVASYASAYTKENRERMQKKPVTEGDASKKTNYAVQVRDMNKAHIHLFTGTKADCERLEKQIDDFLRWAEYDCENEDDYMFEEEWLLGEMENFGHISEIAEREIDERNNYYDYSTGKTYHIINDYFFDLYL